MKVNHDSLLKRLNFVSNSSLWPIYTLSKDLDGKNFSNKKIKNPENMPNRIKSMKFKRNFRSLDPDKKSIFSKNMKNFKNSTCIDWKSRENSSNLEKNIGIKEGYFNEMHLQALRMLPSRRGIQRKTLKTDFFRKKETGLNTERINKFSFVNSVEIQTRLSDDEDL